LNFIFFESIKKDLVLIFGNYFQQIASFVFIIFIAKKISPDTYAIYGSAILITFYLKFLNLGAQFTINKRLSIRSNSSLVNSYLSLIIFSYPVLIAGVLFLIYIFNLAPLLNDYYLYIWIFLSFDNFNQLVQGVLRAKGLSNILGKSQILISICVFILILLFYNWNNYSNPLPLFIKFIITPVVAGIFLGLYAYSRKIIFPSRFFKIKNFKFFLIDGVVLMTYVLLQDFLSSIDRLFVAAYYSKYEFGIYSFAYTIAGPILLLLRTVMFMDYSRYMKVFKKISKKDFLNLRPTFLRKFFLIYFTLFALGGITSYFLLEYFLIEYKPAFNLILLMLLLFIPNILSFQYSIYFISSGANKIITSIIFIAIIISAIFDLIVVFTNHDIYLLLISSFVSKLIIYFLLRFKFNKLNN